MGSRNETKGRILKYLHIYVYKREKGTHIYKGSAHDEIGDPDNLTYTQIERANRY